MAIRVTAVALLAVALLAGCAQRVTAPPAANPAIVGQARAPSAPLSARPRLPQSETAPEIPTTPEVSDRTVHVLSFSALEGWELGDHFPALDAFRTACDKLGDKAADAPLGGHDLDGVPIFGMLADWSPICAEARRIKAASAVAFFERWFVPVSIGGAGQGDALFTAYYEPELRGSRRRGGPYQHPLYAIPDDLVRGEQYLDRAAIDAGALDGRGLELFWLDDPVDSFFLHIQGSGRVRLPDGSVARVGYAGKNGHAYKAIGRTLVDWNEMSLDEVSAQSIKAWIRENPDRQDALLASNPSYVFFQERPELASDPSLGPVGSFGQPIPAQRGIAIDPSYYPMGIPVWVSFDSPVGPMRRLTVAMDTGGAIKGPRRADFFFGSGEAAGAAAGATRSPGRLIALAPRAAIERLSQAGS